ncbi:NUDIX hydrolase [Mycoplasma zalophidermidis]|uniref:NUDIX domain-containing protein n=1 Tax=Mycoplasma zalophidermidis TaxID=398174 RepID=A0ABS6DR42_9MOLU|nr:NUDIX domain-containing protein [Mycoplasma zalophidermidis]MBU4689533.1 NUDIX domain-containing protein [Mycoplasma zalophidermidis]MBU4693411.1 NUDIX domain-containing protein [Mycoplasma zalophidermidis]MCR8966292.1 NUDIX domain-containing protein [Mycoplasma zalophidermidis]
MELLDIYDNERQKTGKTFIRGEGLEYGSNHIVAFLCLFNKKGEMLIQKRVSNKPKYPSLWDVSVGGAVDHGESAVEGIKREALEEIGYNFEPLHQKAAFTINLKKIFCDYFIGFTDWEIEKFEIQKEEVEQLMWADYDTVINLIRENKFMKYHESLIKYIFDIWQMPYTRLSDPNLV